MSEHKLPSEKFDPIYDACKDTGVDGDGKYFWEYVKEYSPDAYWHVSKNFDYTVDGCWGDFLLEAYRTGEIRDRGAMETKDDNFGAEWAKGIAEAMKHLFPEIDAPLWYQLDPAEFDGLVDDPANFAIRCQEINDDVWRRSKNLMPGIIPNGAKRRGEALVEFYKAGILRQGGPLEVCETCGHQLLDQS